jgi:hypothetical protein
MIIDLRDNGGGMLSNYVSSYLLPEDSEPKAFLLNYELSFCKDQRLLT